MDLCWGLQEKSTESKLHRSRQAGLLVAGCGLIESALTF